MNVFLVAPPALPFAPNDYDRHYQDQFSNILRLHFNTINNSITALIVPASGTTANRPTERLLVGQQYYDTTLGIPIWYNGTVWKNASGTTV
jgi:hypothetical protein